MVRAVNTNSVNSSLPENSDDGWTTIPVKHKPLVSFPKYPTEPTKHMLVLNSYFDKSTNKWIWHCYLNDEILSPKPRGRERYSRIQKAFVKSGNFFAECGIVLHSLNISTSRVVELFFGSEEDLWKADALVQEYSKAMTGVDDRIRRMENTGKMVCHGVGFLDQFAGEFVGRWNLKEERLRELEDMNPVFYSTGKRWLYRIRYVHYMSSQSSSDHLWRNGSTWAVTFSDFRVAECFIDGDAEFNFFLDPCAGGLSWYQEGPSRSLLNPGSFGRNPVLSSVGENVPGTTASSSAAAASTSSGGEKSIEKRLEYLVLSENPKEAASTLNLKGESTKDLKVTRTGQHQKTKIQSLSTATIAPVKHDPKPAVTKEQQKSQPPKHLVEPVTTPANSTVINMNRHWKAKPKNQPPPGDDESQFPPLPLPLSAPLPQPLPLPTLPISEPTPTKIPSGTLPGTLNKVSLLESSTPPTENVRPQHPERVKYQYAINAKRPSAKVSLPAKKSTPSGSGGDSSNSAPTAPAPALAGKITTATDAIAPGAVIATTAANKDTSKPTAEDTPPQDALAKRRLRAAAARRRRMERKKAGKNAVATAPATGAATDANTGTSEGSGADKNRQESQGVVLKG